jgi:hypothetical protein
MSNPTKSNVFKTAWQRIKFLGITIAALGAGLAIVNLPIPGIRETIAQKAPILLLPSIANWDYQYQEGMVDLQTAKQLIQNAEHPNDLDLGEQELKSAQSHLNAIPLQGFEHYDDSYYCVLRNCRWQFSSWEIQQRREDVGRTEAILSQERNLQSQLRESTDKIADYQKNYSKATNDIEKQVILTQWEREINQINLLNSNSLMGRIANTEKERVRIDFQKITGLNQAKNQSDRIIQGAVPFAIVAQKLTEGKSHAVAEWQAIIRQWESAISQLQSIPVQNPDYVQSRKVLADYQQQLERAKIRLNEEVDAATLLQTTESQINTLVRNHSSLNRDQAKAELMAIEGHLKKIPMGTTAYDQAQDWLRSLRKRLE